MSLLMLLDSSPKMCGPLNYMLPFKNMITDMSVHVIPPDATLNILITPEKEEAEADSAALHQCLLPERLAPLQLPILSPADHRVSTTTPDIRRTVDISPIPPSSPCYRHDRSFSFERRYRSPGRWQSPHRHDISLISEVFRMSIPYLRTKMLQRPHVVPRAVMGDYLDNLAMVQPTVGVTDFEANYTGVIEPGLYNCQSLLAARTDYSSWCLFPS
ncbi:hypothetical protein XENOCAPTIV_025699 [Xenoophorus captivus]|uniref:Uncharacterized protein n=1 Tax=Xenoophorus captivus TaxID=1517983 RepID=A0ABV0S8N9_9TELE